MMGYALSGELSCMLTGLVFQSIPDYSTMDKRCMQGRSLVLYYICFL